MAGFGHLFKNQAAAYAAFRPSYPADLYNRIYKFADLKSHDLAVDIAAGSGQAAKVLAERFQKACHYPHAHDRIFAKRTLWPLC